MGRNFTPEAILEARGSFIGHPETKREAEPKPLADRPLGPAPRWLDPDERKVWKRLAKEVLPGVVFESDRVMFGAMAVLVNKMETRKPMKAAEMSLMLSIASRFAMTPADRARVSVERAPESKLNHFLNRSKSVQ
jgi:hypothetical protein